MFVLSNENTLANNFLAEMRDKSIQKDSMRFRTNIHRLGEIFAYEISKEFDFVQKDISTPLGTHVSNVFENQPILVTVLRAGLPFYQGLLSYLDKAESAFIGAYRTGEESKDFVEIALNYMASPDLTDRNVIIADPMLATGRSMVKTYETLLKNGKPKSVFVAAIIASQQGVNYVKTHMPDAKLFIGDIDAELTDNAYITPGLGDAGDLAFGPKL